MLKPPGMEPARKVLLFVALTVTISAIFFGVTKRDYQTGKLVSVLRMKGFPTAPRIDGQFSPYSLATWFIPLGVIEPGVTQVTLPRA